MNAAKRVNYLKTILPKVGLDPERLAMYNLSAAMGPRWAEICNEFTERIRQLGPSPIRLAIQAQERRKQP